MDDTTEVYDATCNWWGAADGPSGDGPGSGDAIDGDVLIMPWLLSDDLDGECLGGTLLGIKSAAALQLAGLLPTGDKKDDKNLEKAIERLENSTKAEYWASDSELTADGQKVFDEEKKALGYMGKIKGLDLTALMEAIVEVDRALAEAAIDAATTAGGDAKNLEKAEASYEKGLDHVADGKFDKAAGDFKKAWDFAQKSLP